MKFQITGRGLYFCGTVKELTGWLTHLAAKPETLAAYVARHSH